MSFGQVMVLLEGHQAVGEPCLLCNEPFSAGDHVRFVVIGPPDEENLAKLRAGEHYVAPVRLAHIEGQCKAAMKLKCACCGYEEVFDSLEDAFQRGWDEPNHLSTWPVSCPLCPGVASMGLIDHSEAHARWEQVGRPTTFEASYAEGDVPE